MNPIRLMLVEDDPVWLNGLVRLLQLEEDLTVFAVAKNKEEALALYDPRHVDILLVDITLYHEETGGIETVLDICHLHPGAKIIMLSACKEPELISEAVLSGAVNYVFKENFTEIPSVIREVYLNKASIHHSVSDILRSEFIELKKANLRKKLSSDDCEILKEYAEGKDYKEISQTKFIEVQSLRNKMYKIAKKLGWVTRSNRELANKAKKLGLLK